MHYFKCVERALSLLREREVRILTYTDNSLILISSQQEDRAHTELVTHHITQLGFAVSYGKSALQLSQQVQYLGLHLDAQTMNARLSEECTTALIQLCHRVKTAATLTVGRLMSLLGILSAGLAAHERTSTAVCVFQTESKLRQALQAMHVAQTWSNIAF